MADTILVHEFVSAGGLHGHPDESALQAMGLLMRDAVVADLLRLPADQVGRVSVAGPLPAHPPPRYPHRTPHPVCPRPGQDTLDFLREQAGQHDWVWVIAPESDGWLSACCDRVAPRRWLGSTAAALHTTSSKRRTLARLAAAGLRTPQDFDAPGLALRWVVKPEVGAGAVETFVFGERATAQAMAERRQAAGEAVVLQPWVDGDAMSLSLLCGGARGTQVLSLNRQHLRLDRSGRLGFTGVAHTGAGPLDPRWPALQALADTVTHALPGLRGFVGVDLVWHARHGPVPIEVNARVTNAYVGLSAGLGRNLAGEVLHAGR
jgi:predicted ATP-grasp superfamily ATP-dependent carboligase